MDLDKELLALIEKAKKEGIELETIVDCLESTLDDLQSEVEEAEEKEKED